MYGIGLLLGLGLTFFSTTTTIQTNICNTMPAAPVITSPASGTTTATQEATIGGTATADIAINILDNNQLVASTTADSFGNYGVDVQLSSGSNVLIAQAENNCNQTANSPSITVTYTPPVPPPTPTPPVVTPTKKASVPAVVSVVAIHNNSASVTPVVSPSTTGQSTSSGLILDIYSNYSRNTTAASEFITGSTGIAANVQVVVNGQTIADSISGDNGYFVVRVPLSLGKNNVGFSATAGTSTITKNIQITRSPLTKKTHPKRSLFSILIIILLAIAAFDLIVLLVLSIRNKIKNGRNQ